MSPRLSFFLYTEPWQSAREEKRVHELIEQAYELIQQTNDSRRRGAYHVVMSANAVSTVVLGMN